MTKQITYIRREESNSSVYRFTATQAGSDWAEYFGADYRWHEGRVTVGECKELLAEGWAIETNQHGCAL